MCFDGCPSLLMGSHHDGFPSIERDLSPINKISEKKAQVS
jgi:hypothetical protein